ncbi:hypothetical protein F5I97DRAFT_1929589 [Phlebopus sp. FC_14]|nr:hypothetical protein F5I97DRAFT_1929589 [Phlebopus sp. FC_14]
MEFPTGAGATSGPISPDAWKRAVYKNAPRHFYVELLSPEKQGNHSYGLRICPIKDDNASVATRSSSSSGSGSLGYDIWRKWEDCLWFQDVIEVEYSRMAREKRNRLAAGKGIKKDGVYIHSDQAASFESLPPGPDPHSVAQDIHQYVPKLTKKGTLFRASQATIEQRFAEFRAMIDALFTDEVPTLIKELKATRTFADFFGFWRRDHDLARKSQQELTPNKSRLSVSSSILSSYFSSSTPALSDISPSKSPQTQLQSPKSQKQPPYRSPTTSDASSSSSSVGSSDLTKSPVRGQSTPSRSPATLVPTTRQRPNAGRQPVIVSQDVPLRFGHNPQHMSDMLVNERPTSMLESLPEDREFSSVSVSKLEDKGLRPRRRASSAVSEANRNARIYLTPPHSPSGLCEHAELPLESSTSSPSRYPRYSWQTAHSSASARAAAYFAELDVDYSLPNPHPEHGHRPRASMCSMASVTSDSSADAVVPRYPPGQAALSGSALNGQRRPRPMSLPEDEQGWPDHERWLDADNDGHEQEDDLLDAYFYDSIRPHSPTPSSRPETPTASDVFSYVTPPPEQYLPTYSNKRLSIPISISSGSTNSSYDGMNISIKAMHEDNIIMLRIPRHLPFREVREKIYDKFVQTDRSPISKSFAIAFLVQPPSDTSSGVRSRAGSLSSLGAPETRKAGLHFVASQDEWDQAIAHFGTKVSLRIIGSRE